MAIDSGHLQSALKAFQAAVGYDAVVGQGGWGAAPPAVLAKARKDRASAIRGERHVRPVYEYCARELLARGFRKEYVFPEPGSTAPRKTKVHGGFFEKEVDAGLSLEHTGPLLLVSVKAMLTASRNLKNRVEEAMADAANLHTRYPMLCFGFLMIVPYRMETEKKGPGGPQWRDERVIGPNGQPTPLGDNLVRYVAQLQPRVDLTETPGRYEAVALVVVDLDHDPPTVHPTFPAPDSGVRVEGFFDVLHQRFVERNRFIAEVFG